MSDCVVWFLGREQNMRGLQVRKARLYLRTGYACRPYWQWQSRTFSST